MKRKLLILLLFLLCCSASFLVKTYHFNREAARMALIIGDTEPRWNGMFTPSGLPVAAGVSDFLPLARPNFLPFTIESAMMYAYAQDIAQGKGVPKHDKRLAYLPDVPPYAQMNMALEWVLGWSYRALCTVRKIPKPKRVELQYQDMPDFARFTAVSIRIWTSLIPGLIFLWLVVLRTPLSIACGAGLLHAFSAAALARATGQDIVRGDLCITLFLICVVLSLNAMLKPARWKYAILVLMTVFAFQSWDLCQLLFGAWGAVELLRWVMGGVFSARRRKVWLAVITGIVLSALLLPFHIVYGLIMTGLVCILLPLLALVMYGGNLADKGMFKKFPVLLRRSVLLLIAGGCLWAFHACFVDNPSFRANYSHFSEAMKAKVKFHNIKPADPSLLSYDARMMWTPAMHSANWYIARNFFPSFGSLERLHAFRGPGILQKLWNFFPLTLGGLAILLLLAGLFTPFREAIRRDLPRLMLPLLFTIGYTAGFVYVVRYHEFVIIFLAVSAGLLVHELWRGSRGISSGHFRAILRFLLGGGMIFLLCFELYATLSSRTRELSNKYYLRPFSTVIRWFRDTGLVREKTVLTDFMTGPMLMCYCGANLVNQPQFGMAAIRQPVEDHLMIMFHGKEKDLADFCDRYGVDFVLYDLDMPTSMHPCSLRYIAAAKEIKPFSPANLMLHFPQKLRYFREVRTPSAYRRAEMKYRLFRRKKMKRYSNKTR